MARKVRFAPSILAADHADLQHAVQQATQGGAIWAHIDIMDGHFVPNLTFGPQTVADLRPHTDLFFDTHLMLAHPEQYVEAFSKAGSDLITVHVEADHPIRETLRHIRSLSCQCGLALNPPTDVETMVPHLDNVDLALVMTVNPGFGGQTFMANQLHKVERLAHERDSRGLNYRIEVDGGVGPENWQDCLRAGADTIVAGTSFYKAADPSAFLNEVEDGTTAS